MIVHHLCCARCWKLAPAKVRRRSYRAYKECVRAERAFTASKAPEDDASFYLAWVDHDRWNKVVIWAIRREFNRRGLARAEDAIPAEMERDLKELGLI